jgi:hypothetical protein
MLRNPEKETTEIHSKAEPTTTRWLSTMNWRSQIEMADEESY